MIRLLFDPPRFECETATDAAALSKLLGIVVERIETGPARPASARPALSTVSPPYEDETGRTVNETPGFVNAPASRATMKPTGKLKDCRKCAAKFPVVTRADCASVLCPGCRPPKQNRRPKDAEPLSVRACAKLGCHTMFRPERDTIVHCDEHRLGPGQNRASAGKPIAAKAPIPAAGQPGRGPIHPDQPMAICRRCGASVPEFESINGECLECAPIGARKATA